MNEAVREYLSRHPEAVAKRDDGNRAELLQQEIKQERLFLTGRSDRIAIGVEAVLLRRFLRQWAVGDGSA